MGFLTGDVAESIRESRRAEREKEQIASNIARLTQNLKQCNTHLLDNPSDIAGYVARATILKQLRGVDDAARSIDPYIQLHPEDVNGYYHKADCFMSHNIGRKAKDTWKSYIEKNKLQEGDAEQQQTHLLSLYFQKADAFEKFKHSDLAVKTLDFCIAQYPREISIYTKKASLLQKHGNISKALKVWDYYITNNPILELQGHLNKEKILLNSDWKLAVKMWDKYISTNPYDAAGYQHKADILKSHELYEEALNTWSDYRLKNPSAHEGYADAIKILQEMEAHYMTEDSSDITVNSQADCELMADFVQLSETIF